MATAITGLSTLADNGLADTDWFVVHDLSAGTDKKIAATGVLGMANTFTPVLAFAGASVGITYTTQSGRYIRTGNLVWVAINIILSSKGSSTGVAAIYNLPYAYAGLPSVFNVWWSGLASNAVFMSGLSGASSSISLYYASAAATGLSAITDTQFGNTTTLYVTGSYRTTDAR